MGYWKDHLAGSRGLKFQPRAMTLLTSLFHCLLTLHIQPIVHPPTHSATPQYSYAYILLFIRLPSTLAYSPPALIHSNTNTCTTHHHPNPPTHICSGCCPSPMTPITHIGFPQLPHYWADHPPWPSQDRMLTGLCGR